MSFGINGGFATYDDILRHLNKSDGKVDSVMVGRAVLNNSMFFENADTFFFSDMNALRAQNVPPAAYPKDADELFRRRADKVLEYAEYAYQVQHGKFCQSSLQSLISPI